MNLEDVGRTVSNRVLETVGRAASRVQESRPLPTDVLESDDAYLVVFDAPGATQTDVQVRYNDGAVEVRIDRFREFYDDYEMRVPGRGMSLDGRAQLPPDAVVEPEAASATLRANGTLEVRVPKDESADRDANSGTVEIATPDDGEHDADDAESDVEEDEVDYDADESDDESPDGDAGFEDEDDPADV